jgi:hypothetical protein
MTTVKQTTTKQWIGTGLLSAGLIVAAIGCGGNTPPPYPGTQADTSQPPAEQPMPSMTVPADAEKLAQAPYSQVSFPVQQEPGLYFIYDVTAGKVVAETSLSAESFGKQITMSDLKNVTHDVDSSHEYRISFRKQRMMTPATMPAGAT